MEPKPNNNAPSSTISRRSFMQAAGTIRPIMAGPFDNEYLAVIPADKKLDPAWIRSLYERCGKQTYSDEELKYIGMPVGGIGAGHVYLGGDGRL